MILDILTLDVTAVKSQHLIWTNWPHKAFVTQHSITLLAAGPLERLC